MYHTHLTDKTESRGRQVTSQVPLEPDPDKICVLFTRTLSHWCEHGSQLLPGSWCTAGEGHCGVITGMMGQLQRTVTGRKDRLEPWWEKDLPQDSLQEATPQQDCLGAMQDPWEWECLVGLQGKFRQLACEQGGWVDLGH